MPYVNLQRYPGNGMIMPAERQNNQCEAFGPVFWPFTGNAGLLTWQMITARLLSATGQELPVDIVAHARDGSCRLCRIGRRLQVQGYDISRLEKKPAKLFLRTYPAGRCYYIPPSAYLP